MVKARYQNMPRARTRQRHRLHDTLLKRRIRRLEMVA